MKIKMVKDMGVSNDGIGVVRLKAGEIYDVPRQVNLENAQILIVEGLANKIDDDKEEVVEDDDTEVIDIDDDENDDDDGEEDKEDKEPEVVKELTDKPIFNKYNKNKR